MSNPAFVQVNPGEYRSEIFGITMEYFGWMNWEVIKAFGISIPTIVGKPLNEYVYGTLETVCSGVPPEGVFYLLLEDDITVGSGGLRRLPDGSVEIVRIFVRDKFRGRGYGRAILARLLADAADFGYTIVRLDTGNFMQSAHRIYESFGFEDCPPYEGAEAPPQLVPHWRYMSKRLA
jgi:GNAT superfamily N-acetyltransferase